MKVATDFLIIGSGILGLSMAKVLKEFFPRSKVVVIDKENNIGVHTSGRNSGVLHAGFYYHPDSLKAKFTRQGNEELTSYCLEKGLKINKCGKVVVATSEEEMKTLHELKRRGDMNGVELYLIDEKDLKKIEPKAKTYKLALWSPNTSVVDSLEVLHSVYKDMVCLGVDFYFNTKFDKKLDGRKIKAGDCIFEYGVLINCAGLYADKIAKEFGFAQKYVLLPFKGLYLEYIHNRQLISRNIYPVPNIKNPFLGVHFTVKVNGGTKIGPNAMPAFWRENYNGLKKFNLSEFLEILRWNTFMFLKSSLFRDTAFQELRKYLKQFMLKDAEKLIEGIDLNPKEWKWARPGIRPQLLNIEKFELVQDFIVEGDGSSFHILNAVSPAFTASIPFARYVIEHYISGGGNYAKVQQNTCST